MHKTMPYIVRVDLEIKKKSSQQIQNPQNRSLIVDAHAFGSFRKDLINQILV